MRYTDPTGHLTEEEQRTLLGDRYDELMYLWKTYDPYWIEVLNTIEAGGVLFASVLDGQELHFEGSGTSIRTRVYGGNAGAGLTSWQGKGAYGIRNVGDSDETVARRRDQMFDRHETDTNTMIQPVFNYGASISYVGARTLVQSIGPTTFDTATSAAFRANGASDGLSFFGGIATDGLIGLGISKYVNPAGQSPVGWAVLAVDVAVGSTIATYNQPKSYSSMGFGGPDVNPHIGLDQIGR